MAKIQTYNFDANFSNRTPAIENMKWLKNKKVNPASRPITI